MIFITQSWLKLGVGGLPPQQYRVSITPVPDYILEINILWGLSLQTSVRGFRLRERCISFWVVQVTLRQELTPFVCSNYAELQIKNNIDSLVGNCQGFAGGVEESRDYKTCTQSI